MTWFMPVYPTPSFVILPHSLFLGFTKLVVLPYNFFNILISFLPQGCHTCCSLFLEISCPSPFLVFSYFLGLNTVVTCLSRFFSPSLFLYCTQNDHEINSCLFLLQYLSQFEVLYAFTYYLHASLYNGCSMRTQIFLSCFLLSPQHQKASMCKLFKIGR